MLTEKSIKWLLFGVLAGVFPVLFFLFMAIGFFPLPVIVALTLKQPKLLLFSAVHLVIYGGAFYLAAIGGAKGISKLPLAARAVVVTLFLAFAAWLTLQPVYGWGGYATSIYKNLYELRLADF
jgi:hypothetical protein